VTAHLALTELNTDQAFTLKKPGARFSKNLMTNLWS